MAELMADFDDTLDLIPAAPGSDDGLAADDAAIVSTDVEPAPLGVSWLFDMGAESFIRHGLRPQETRGEATLIQWIDVYLHTARGALPVFPDWFGMPDPMAIFGRPVVELSEAQLLEDMQNMTNHPNIAEVSDARIYIDPLDDAAYVEVDVLSDPPTEDVSLMTLRVRAAS